MKKTMIKFISGVAALALALVSFQGVSASTSASPLQAASAYYVSPTGNDANIGTINAPFKTIQKATSKTAAGDTIILLAGTYTGATTVTEVGAPNTPIVIRGEGAVFNGGSLTFKNSQWLIIENLSFVGGTNQVTLQNSHYLAFRGNKFDFVTRRCNSLICLFLEGMHDPDAIAELQRIYDPESIAPLLDREFPYPRAETCKRFGNLWGSALGHDRQSIKHPISCAHWEILKIPPRSLYPRNSAC